MTKRGMGRFTSSLVLICSLAAGCSSSHKAETPAELQTLAGRDVARVEIDAPPKQVMETAKKVIASAPFSLTIEKEQSGTLETSWQPFPGEMHIIRRWPQHTRYHITISPVYEEPNRTRVDVTEETEQQVAGATRWTRDSDLVYPERAAEVARAIKNASGK